ncbi:DNA repair protein [Tuber magnatum]|uniref:DNA repair protein n=1 Tax=Tuber magnatum TaxID=42249 RepID=A0A317SX92_9PEZI|nr:DNA repair protein [Tuber magnatum]
MSTPTSSQPKVSLPLVYQQELFEEVCEQDQLVILARGLGLLRIVTSLLHKYDAVGNNLVLLIGADDRENGWLGEALAEHAVRSGTAEARGLKIINNEVAGVSARAEMYKRGGIFSVTSRILVTDMLTDLMDCPKISGVVVLHSERVVATSTEAFILRIYRQKNQEGFLKAFSDKPEPFTTGFAPLATMMRNLFLRSPSLWPRFHVTVAKSLETKEAEVVELEVAMTDSMREIQAAVLECIETSISELRKSNSSLELDDWTVDSALHKSFDVVVQRQLDPVWHRISRKTKQIVNDLTVLRRILHCLLTYDCVTFYQYLETILATHAPPPGSTRSSQSPWLFLDAAHTIFTLAKRRVYTGKADLSKKASGKVPHGLEPVLEELPKWAMLGEILDEIEKDGYFNPAFSQSSRSTLIMCSDESTCRQIREFLQTMHETPLEDLINQHGELEKPSRASAAYMMRRKLRAYFAWKPDFAKLSALFFRGRAPPPNKRRRIRGGAAAASGPNRQNAGAVQVTEEQSAQVAALLAGVQPTEGEQNLKQEIGADSFENMEDYYEFYEMNNLIVVHPYDGDMDERLLDELRPRYVIMYEPDPSFIRRIEVYRSSHKDREVRVYFLYYGASVEEKRYLSTVRREKDSFTKLVREKGSMSVTLTLDAKAVEDPQEAFLRTVNTRIAGGGRVAATAVPPRVVVDIREFRSSLPSLLHGRSVEVVPCTLTVGDYILSPDICVERKSVNDLISSFKDGRLYTQCENMLLYYKNPMVLIEFDQNKSFSLEPFADLTGNIGQHDLQAKIVLLTIAFPKVKLIWSSSPYQTAEIFEELKRNQKEPDPLEAVKLGLETGEEIAGVYNQTPQEILRSIPGINPKNIKTIMSEVENLVELCNMEEKDISALIGEESGKQVHRFLNRSAFS